MAKSPYTYFVSETTIPEAVPNQAIYFVIGLDYRKRYYKNMMVKALEAVGETIKKSDFIEETDEEMKCFGYPTYKVKKKAPKEGLVLAQRYFHNLGYRPHTMDSFVQIYDLWRMRSLYLIVLQGKVVSKMCILHQEIFTYDEKANIMTIAKCNEEINGYPPEAMKVMDVSVETPFVAVTVYGLDKEGTYDSNFCAIYTLPKKKNGEIIDTTGDHNDHDDNNKENDDNNKGDDNDITAMTTTTK